MRKGTQMTGTFVEHDVAAHAASTSSLQKAQLGTLTERETSYESESEDKLGLYPPPVVAPSPTSRERKATVKRRSPRHLGAQMNIFASGRADETGPGESHHSRRGEISAEVFTGNKVMPYRRTLIEKDSKTRDLIRSAVDNCMLFADMNDTGRDEVVDAFSKVTAQRGKLLIEEGEWGDLFYVLVAGTCDAIKVLYKPQFNDKVPSKVKSYGPGGSFGELALMYNEPRAATIRVTSDTAELWVIDRLTYKNISVHFKVLKQKSYEEALRRVQPLYNLSTEDMIRLVDNVEEKTVTAGPVCRLGEPTDEVLVLLQGVVTYTSAKETGQASPGDVFNEEALFKQVPSACTVVATGDKPATFVSLNRTRMEEIIGPLSARNPHNARPKSVMAPRSQQNHRHHIAMKFEDLDLHMRPANGAPSPVMSTTMLPPPSRVSPSIASSILSPPPSRSRPVAPSVASSVASNSRAARELVLGVGTFGKVIICKHVPTGETYAMKKLIKSWIVENCLEQHVVDERNVMTLTDHPFILKLHSSFWDERYVYLVLELCLGGELFTYLRKLDKFNEQQARFYAASIVQAFEHLHNKSIIYRDLKPENLMLDDRGFLKVVDFGLAKVVKGRTWTICGTPEYLAPEVVLSKGHNRGVDYWALGILIFEMVAGDPPFVGDDNMQIYKLIVENKISFPSFMTPDCREIVRDFTRASLIARLGLRRPGIKLIREHAWFIGFDWAALDALKLTPPIIPKVRNRLDTSNFEEYTPDESYVEPDECPWKPSFPYEVRDGKTDFSYVKEKVIRGDS